MSLFMRMVATAGVVTCALVTSAPHPPAERAAARDFGRPMEDASAGMIFGRTCGSPPTQRCTAEATNAGAEDAAKQGVEALQTKKPKKAAQPQ